MKTTIALLSLLFGLVACDMTRTDAQETGTVQNTVRDTVQKPSEQFRYLYTWQKERYERLVKSVNCDSIRVLIHNRDSPNQSKWYLWPISDSIKLRQTFMTDSFLFDPWSCHAPDDQLVW